MMTGAHFFQFWVFLFVRALVLKTAKSYKKLVFCLLVAQSLCHSCRGICEARQLQDGITVELWGRDHRVPLAGM